MAALASASAEPADPPLTRVGDVLRLPPRELRLGHRVDLHAVVTLSDPVWGLLAVQDDTGGIEVDVSGLEGTLSHGDEVRVTGFTSHEGLSPVVVLARVERSGGVRAPECRPAVTAAVLPDNADARCVEVAVTMRGSRPIHEARWRLELDLAGKRIEGVVLGVNELGSLSAGEPIVVRGVPLAVRTAREGSEEVGFRLFAQGADAVRRTQTTATATSTPPASVGGADGPRRTLRTVMEVKSLDASEARRGQPVRIRGVVTLASADGMSIFLQDTEAGVYVGSAEGMAPPPVGSLIEVVGTTAAGFVAPTVKRVSVASLGRAPLPRSLSAEAVARPLSAATENAWIELSGVLRRTSTQYSLCTAGRELSLHPVRGDARTLSSFVDAEVTARGVLAAEYQTGEVVGRRILIELPRGVEVVRPPPADPFALHSEPIPRLIAYRPEGTPVHRVRTTGVVTGIFFPNRLFLSDGEKGLACQVAGPHDAKVGEAVDVVGFLPADGAQRRLADALVRRRGPGSSVSPLSINAEELRGGEFAAMLVRVTAALRRRHHELGREHLFMEDGREVFEAILELPRPDRTVDAAREGAILRLTGVCDAAGETSPAAPAAQPCRLLLRSPADLEILRPASWWTRERSLGVLGLMTAFAATVVAWVVTLGRRVARQTATIRRQIEEEADLRDRLRQAEKMESIGRLAGGVAHDFNNLLTGILGFCDLLLWRAGMSDSAQRWLGEIKKAAERAADLTRQLLAFSRKQVLEPRVLDLTHVVTDLAPFFRRLVGESVEIQTVLAPDTGRVEADPGQIQQVLLNLVSNARDAMPDGGLLLIETGNIDLDDSYARQRTEVQAGPYVFLSVTDNGVGISPEVKARIFEPFFTTKTRGRGTGLGLATVEGIVKQSRGHIGVYSEPGHGSTFRVYLPRVDAPESPREAAVAPAISRSAAEVILLVEDEEIVTQVAAAALGEAGYRVLSARNADDAMRLAAARTDTIHLLLTDVILAGPTNGRQLADTLARARPGLRTLFMSGYTDNVIVRQGVLEEGVEFLPKPFTPEALCRKVRVVLDR